MTPEEARIRGRIHEHERDARKRQKNIDRLRKSRDKIDEKIRSEEESIRVLNSWRRHAENDLAAYLEEHNR